MNPGRACQTGGMSDDRLYLIDTFAFLFSASAARMRETSPLNREMNRG
ncbi:hypothetical protein GETHOR_11580 [Geothrix oryzae]|uniref:Uncharacterized protein n=1 Tax=Geothrix oryzae TaxID=2927975 RepID=A0ABN6UWC8_9BACT|nr:hypothetical protein GETHOR_11580 [Geothrix oryzae]